MVFVLCGRRWTGPIAGVNAHGAVYRGAVPVRFGNRKPPSSAYASLAPIFYADFGNRLLGDNDDELALEPLFVGGNFWDGRATGELLGNPAADQARGPFLNTVEQALPDSACVVYRVCTASYDVAFTDVWGAEACAIEWPADVETVCRTEGATVALDPDDRMQSAQTYNNIALSIAAYEDSPEVNVFSSKYDQTFDGKVKLNKQEQLGYALFQGKGKCKLCHISGKKEVFTDFTFDNLGVPLPLPTRILIQISQILIHGWPWILLGLAAVGAGVYLALREEKVRRRLDAFLVQLPMFGELIVKNGLARFAYVLGSLLAGGIDRRRPVMDHVDAMTIGKAVIAVTDGIVVAISAQVEVGEEAGVIGTCRFDQGDVNVAAAVLCNVTGGSGPTGTATHHHDARLATMAVRAQQHGRREGTCRCANKGASVEFHVFPP